MAPGPRDTTSLVMLTGWDATALKSHQLRDGTTFLSIVGSMQDAMSGLNAELYNDPLWASMVSYTDTPELEYRIGSSNGMERHTEYGRPDAKRAQTDGHMLPYLEWDRGLGWTWDYLRRARMSQIEADIFDAVKDVKDRWRLQILTRVLTRGDDSGAAKGLGSSGYSPGFATAAASTNVDFTPPSYGGTAFTSDHEHYVPIAGGAFTAAVFTDVRLELMEHGHEPPYNMIIGSADAATVAGLTGFVKVAETNVRLGDDTAVATFGPQYNMNGAYAIGTISDTVVWVTPGMPQYYGFAWKSYGPNSQRNPLRIRLDKGAERPQFIAMADPRSGNGAWPLQYMMLFGGFGVGVGDRTNGTPRYVNNAAWSDGTAT